MPDSVMATMSLFFPKAAESVFLTVGVPVGVWVSVGDRLRTSHPRQNVALWSCLLVRLTSNLRSFICRSELGLQVCAVSHPVVD